MWTRPVTVHIILFHCVKTGMALPTYKYRGRAFSTTLRILIWAKRKSLELKLPKWLYTKPITPQEKLDDAFCVSRVLCPTQNASKTKRATTMTDNVRDVHKLPTLRDDKCLCDIGRRHRFMTAWMLQAGCEPVLPERVSVQTVHTRLDFLLALEKPFHSRQLIKYHKDIYI